MDVASRIDELWETGELDPAPIEEAVGLLDRGEARVAEKRDGEWVVNEWAKKAILLYFRLRKVEPMDVGGLHFLDKIPLKSDYAQRGGPRRAPGSRAGSYLSEGVVLMPGYVNIGAWVGPRTMVDTWATVGSCAQVGADVHLSGGVGLGGVLEPPQARPVIVEDGASSARRSVVVEGVVVGEGAVIAPNVVLGLDPDHRRHRAHAGGASRARASAVGRPARTRLKDYPAGRYELLRAHRRRAERLDGPQDLPERRAARVRDRREHVRRGRAQGRRRRPARLLRGAPRHLPEASWPGG